MNDRDIMSRVKSIVIAPFMRAHMSFKYAVRYGKVERERGRGNNWNFNIASLD